MMKKTFFLFVLFFGFLANGQVINFSDSNLKTKLLSANPNNQIAKAISGNYVDIDLNGNSEIEVEEATLISELIISNQNSSSSSLISDLSGIENFSNLTILNCSYNNIYNLNLSSFPNLVRLFCQVNHISLLDCSANTNLESITCFQNQLSVLNVDGLTSLSNVDCSSNQLTTLDFSSCISLSFLTCYANNLNKLFIKNGKNESIGFGSNPNLQYICADESQFSNLQNLLDLPGYPNAELNSYCSFLPGGNYNVLNGQITFDNDINGCDDDDIHFSNSKVKVLQNGNLVGSFYSNNFGEYSIPLYNGSYTIVPAIENPNYFVVTPPSLVVNFPNQSSPITQDFCVSPNGIFNNLEVVILPLTPVRPGFDSRYKIVYRNTGNTVQSGYVTFNYDDSISDLVSANPSIASQSYNLLSWNYSNLLPFETRIIDVVINLNSPTEVPPVNNGDDIGYGAIVYPIDSYYFDNHAELKQIVVGSLDPNDKTCTEGNVVSPEIIGKDVHYMIRFENTGTYAAENIVVKDMIDTTKFDISTLVPINSSHPHTTIIKNNRVEFIFENINLPFDNLNNDGYVAFKIKTKPTLNIGDTFSNNASIYFDYNFPINTNTAITTIEVLKNNSFEFSKYFKLFPNPTKNELNIAKEKAIEISSISIYNALGQILLSETNPSDSIDISHLKSGNYFIKVITNKGSSTSKFLKE